MTLIITVLHILVCLALIFVVLLQKGGSDMGAAFGGGSSQSVFGSQGTGSFLGKTTAILATTFMLTSLGLAVLSTQGSKRVSVMEQPAAPAAPAEDAMPLPAKSSDAPVTPPPVAAPMEPATPPKVETPVPLAAPIAAEPKAEAPAPVATPVTPPPAKAEPTPTETPKAAAPKSDGAKKEVAAKPAKSEKSTKEKEPAKSAKKKEPAPADKPAAKPAP